MCKNEKTSLVSFFVAGIIGLYLITVDKNSIRALGFFLLTFILIQLIEFFIWNQRRYMGLSFNAGSALNYASEGDPNNKNVPSSDFLTRLIVIALWLQPLIQTYMAYQYGRETMFRPLIILMLGVYILTFLYAGLRVLNPNLSFSSQPHTGVGNTGVGADGKTAGGHLNWMGSDGSILGGTPLTILYLFGLFFGLLFTIPSYFGWVVIVFGIITLVYAMTQHSKYEVGSMWCLYAVLLGFILLILSFLPDYRDKGKDEEDYEELFP